MSMTLELTRRRARERALREFEYIRTCLLARELCSYVRLHRVVLNREDVHRFCTFIAGLCKESGCLEQSNLCLQAAEAILKGDESGYLELCALSCRKCGEHRRPMRLVEGARTTYVA